MQAKISLALALLALTLFPALARAEGGFGVLPVRVDFTPESRSASITVTNEEATQRVMQIEILSWRQENGRDVVEPTSDVIAAPPVFTLAPFMTQTIRVALVHRLPADKESCYRLIVKEVPSQLRVAHYGAVVNLEFNLPVFVAPADVSLQKLQWDVARVDAKHIRLSVYNPTNVHVHFDSVSLDLPHGGSIAGRGVPYVLAGGRKSWLLNVPSPVGVGDSARISVKMDGTRETFSKAVVTQ